MADKTVTKRAALDTLLLNEAASGKSPNEISAATGGAVSPERAAARIKELLASRADYLSVREQQALVMHDLQNAKALLWEKIDGWGKDGVEAFGPLIRLLKIIGDRVDALAKEGDDKAALITAAQARGFIKALEIVYDRLIERLSEQYPEVEQADVRQMVNKELPAAFEYVNKMAEDS